MSGEARPNGLRKYLKIVVSQHGYCFKNMEAVVNESHNYREMVFWLKLFRQSARMVYRQARCYKKDLKKELN